MSLTVTMSVLLINCEIAHFFIERYPVTNIASLLYYNVLKIKIIVISYGLFVEMFIAMLEKLTDSKNSCSRNILKVSEILMFTLSSLTMSLIQ